MLGECNNRGGTTQTDEFRPFAWQRGQRLILLDAECSGWVVAELQFDPYTRGYSEVFKATYDWPREAVGVILSRVMSDGLDVGDSLAVALDNWSQQRQLQPSH